MVVGWRSFPVLVSVYFQGEISVWVRVPYFDLYKVFEFQVTRKVLSLVICYQLRPFVQVFYGQKILGSPGWRLEKNTCRLFPVWRIWISFKKDLLWYCNVKSFNISTSSQFVCLWIWRVNSSFGRFKQIGTSLGVTFYCTLVSQKCLLGQWKAMFLFPWLACEG